MNVFTPNVSNLDRMDPNYRWMPMVINEEEVPITSCDEVVDEKRINCISRNIRKLFRRKSENSEKNTNCELEITQEPPKPKKKYQYETSTLIEMLPVDKSVSVHKTYSTIEGLELERKYIKKKLEIGLVLENYMVMRLNLVGKVKTYYFQDYYPKMINEISSTDENDD